MKFKDKSVTEKLAGSFAIALPEYLVRYDDECDTVFEKIEAEMRPANYPLLDSAYDDNKTTFEKVAAKIRPMHLKMKRRKMITREQPITRYAPVIAKKNIIVDMQGKKLRVVATIRKGGDDNVLGNIPYLLAGKPVQVPTAAGVVTETWEDVYGNNVRVTEELKKLKIATEEALRKDEDEKYQKDRMKKINVMLNICNLDMANKQELKKNQQKFEIKSMNQKDLIKVLKANKEDDVVIQHTQYSTSSPRKRTKKGKKKLRKSTPQKDKIKNTLVTSDKEVKIKSGVEDEPPASEYMITPLDYYINGQLMNHLKTDENDYFLGGRY